MVQESVSSKNSCGSDFDYSNRDSKRVGFESMQKREQEKKENERKLSLAMNQNKGQYGAWGQTLKNRENFNNLNCC